MAIFQSIKPQEQVDFVKNLSLLVKSGKPINESFDLLSKQALSSAMVKTLKIAKEKVERGTPLSRVFEESPYFGKVFVSFIRAGEESGTLDENLLYLAEWLERDSTLKKEISSATLYPKIIVVFAVVLSAVLSIFVLPQLVPIFGTLDVDLPITTKILLFVSELMQSYAVYVVIGLIAFIALVWLIFRIRVMKRLWHTVILRIPVVGIITKEYQLTIISQLIATLFKSGLTINNSLDIIAESVTNMRYKEAIEKVKERVLKGTGFAETMNEFPHLFPGVFVSVVSTGEQTGSYSNSFQYLAEFFATRVTERTKKLPTVLEPILLILIGVFVAFIASAIIMPIYEVTKGIY
jgi:type IV pilus assembly protein PilC